ncbi:DUF4258 domain-containing protein [Halochromatium glycolicum]|uniref:DUF4258 domain-containing protein n=1 Tax=Halochromatium glycolicum TaxID=85075 RepID=UPI00190D8E0D|nr:DUF4258 domain-containing protein [Halochromatium glycolicum]
MTEHAKKRCIRRKIRREWIARALEHPARIEADPDDPDLVHVLCLIPERTFRALRVIYNETADPVAIVTA